MGALTDAELTPFVRAIAYKMRRVGMVPASVSMDDLVQAGVVSGLRALRRYDGGKGASKKTFVSHRVYGAIQDEVQRQMRLSVGESYDALEELHAAPGHMETPERHAMRYERMTQLVEAIARLERREQAILQMQYNGIRNTRIAEKYGLSPARIGQIYARAVQQLRGAMQ